MLIQYGATGIAVSVDSVDPQESLLTRRTQLRIHRQLISNLKEIGKNKKGFELGINSVVSSVTANSKTVRGLLEFGQSINADYVKFQPIFNDGYVGTIAPQLMLNSSHSNELSKISTILGTFDHPLSNPPEFWKNLSDLSLGKSLDPQSCNIQKHSIVTKKNLGICYWLTNSSFGDATKLNAGTIQKTRANFEKAKTECKVEFHCFCTQPLSHIWSSGGKLEDDGNN